MNPATDTVGLVEWLKALVDDYHLLPGHPYRDSLDVIQSQAARIAEMEGGLRPFARGGDVFDLTGSILAGIAHLHGDLLLQARSLLSEEGAKTQPKETT